MADRFTKEWIRKKSKQLELPFANCLRGLMLEELFYLILSENKPLELVLESDKILGTDAYQSDKEPRICFLTVQDLEKVRPVIASRLQKKKAAKESVSSVEDIEKRIRDVQNASRFHQEIGGFGENGGEIIWQLEREMPGESERERILSVTASLFDMKVPFTLVFQRADAASFYKEEAHLSGIAKKAPLTYYRLAPEQDLSGKIYRIWTNLELISTMEDYDTVYLALKNQAIDGRRIYEELKKLPMEKQLKSNRIEIIESYREYRYMQKRWISYCKNKYPSEKEAKGKEWGEVIALLCAFFEPIWNSLKEDTVFIGDWMPELGRFM